MTEDRLVLDNHLKMMFIDEKSKIVLKKYNHFIKYYLLNRYRFFRKVKWNLVGFFKYLGINLYGKDDKASLMIDLFTPFSIDKDIRHIKKFYNLTRSIIAILFFWYL